MFELESPVTALLASQRAMFIRLRMLCSQPERLGGRKSGHSDNLAETRAAGLGIPMKPIGIPS
jgi:hypothetical protein